MSSQTKTHPKMSSITDFQHFPQPSQTQFVKHPISLPKSIQRVSVIFDIFPPTTLRSQAFSAIIFRRCCFFVCWQLLDKDHQNFNTTQNGQNNTLKKTKRAQFDSLHYGRLCSKHYHVHIRTYSFVIAAKEFHLIY